MKFAKPIPTKKLMVALPLLVIVVIGVSGIALAASRAEEGGSPAAWGPFPPPPAAPVFPGPFVVDIDTPDWHFEDFYVGRLISGVAEAAFLNNEGETSALWAHPSLQIDTSLGNSGDELSPGNTSFAYSSVLVQKPDGTTLFTGTSERWVPLSQLDDGYLACGATSLIARVPEGLLGDNNPQNDWAIAAADAIGSFDRDLLHSQNPIVGYEGQGSNYGGLDEFSGTGTVTINSYGPMEFLPADEPYIRVAPSTEALGDCPPLPTLSNTDTTETYHLWTRVYLNNSFLGEVGPLPPWVAPAIELPDRLHDDDIVCVEVEIDPVEPAGTWGPSGWVLETNENNNMAVIVRQWTQHWFNGNQFDTVFENPTFGEAGCDAIEVVVTDNSTVVIIMATASALALGFVLFAVGGRIFPGLKVSGAGRVGLVVIALAGAAVGGIGGSLVPGSPVASVSLSDVEGGYDGLTCDRYLDAASGVPGENAVVDPNQIRLALSLRTDAPEPAPEHYLLRIVPPSGRETFLPAWDGQQGGKPEGYSIRDFDLTMALASVNGPGEIERGPYEWSVVQGQVGAGGDLQPYATICSGSTRHNFVVPNEAPEPSDGEEPITPTFTPSPTATIGIVVTTAPPTATYTPHPPTVAPEPADSSGPKVSGANASPNPTLTTEPVTVSATVSDPSGVDNVVLYYRTSKNAYTSVPMKGSGNNYSITIGPLTPAGSYDFRIYAVDDLGNANCDPGNVASCPGGTFQVNIP